jgi:hypothetical protein
MSYLYKYLIEGIIVMILLSINLVISLLFTTLLCGLLFFYIRQRNDAIETRMTTLFNLIQSEAEKQHAYRMSQASIHLRGGGSGSAGTTGSTPDAGQSPMIDSRMYSHLISNMRNQVQELKEVNLDDEADAESNEDSDAEHDETSLAKKHTTHPDDSIGCMQEDATTDNDDYVDALYITKEGGDDTPTTLPLQHNPDDNTEFNAVDALVMNMNSGVLHKNARQILESFDTIHAIKMSEEGEEGDDDMAHLEALDAMDALDDFDDTLVGVSASDVRLAKNVVVCTHANNPNKNTMDVSDDIIGCEVLDETEIKEVTKTTTRNQPQREEIFDEELAEAILVRHDVSEDIHKIPVSDDEADHEADNDAHHEADHEGDSVSMTGSAVGSVVNGRANPYNKIPVALLRQMAVDRRLTENSSTAAKLKKKQIIEMLVQTV